MLEWLQIDQKAIWWMVGASILTFLVFMIIVPILIVRIPSDYFSHERFQKRLWTNHHLALRTILLIGKNLLGCIFIAAGLLMLLLPGQGFLTILAGIILLDFPGKYRLVRWIVARPRVLQTLNWLRQRAGKSSLYLDD